MKFLALVFLLLTSPALAQQAPPPSPEMQAMQSEVMQQLNAKLQCTMQAITLQQQVEKLQAELKALKEPAEKK